MRDGRPIAAERWFSSGVYFSAVHTVLAVRSNKKVNKTSYLYFDTFK